MKIITNQLFFIIFITGIFFNPLATANKYCSKIKFESEISFTNDNLNINKIPDGLFLTSPKSKKVPQYLINAREAYKAADIQINAILKVDSTIDSLVYSFRNYFENLKSLHYLLLKGIDGYSTYEHPGSGNYFFDTQTISPGKLRNRNAMYNFNSTSFDSF